MAPVVHGLEVDGQTRCAHWHSPVDVVAIRMFCCGEFYACKDCHDALAGHAAQVWPRELFDRPAVLCGNCRAELTIEQYLNCNSECPYCRASFNPRCASHYPHYFALAGGETSPPQEPSESAISNESRTA